MTSRIVFNERHEQKIRAYMQKCNCDFPEAVRRMVWDCPDVPNPVVEEKPTANATAPEVVEELHFTEDTPQDLHDRIVMGIKGHGKEWADRYREEYKHQDPEFRKAIERAFAEYDIPLDTGDSE